MANANWNNPTTTSLYTDVLTNLKDRDEDLAKQFDGSTATNVVTGTIKWDSSAGRWKKWTGSAWGELAATYSLTAVSASGLITASAGILLTGPATVGSSGARQFSYEYPVTRFYVGDGTGYSFAFSKRAASVTTDLVTIEDDGVVRIIDGNSYSFGSGTAFLNGSSASNYLRFFTASAERMRIDSAGNVGLGVTPSDWNSTYKVLQIGSQASLSSVGGYTLLSANSYSSDTTRYIGTGAASYYQQVSGAHYWFSAPSGTAGSAITFTQAMTLRSENGLAIGGAGYANVSLSVERPVTGSNACYGVYSNGVVQSGVTAAYYGVTSAGGTAAASFTLPSYIHFNASSISLGAGSAVSQQYGFYSNLNATTASTDTYNFYGSATSATTGKNMYGLRLRVAQGTGVNYNLYLDGTAQNYLAGSVGIQTSADNTYSLKTGGACSFGANTYVAAGFLRVTDGGTAAIPSIQPGNDGDTGMYWPGTNSIGFTCAGAELARMVTGIGFLVGATTTIPGTATSGIQLYEVNNNYGRINIGKTVSGGQTGVGMYHNGTVVGSIGYTDTATSFNTSSDYRLKENVEPMVGALEKLQLLKPVTYTWKSNGEASQGFIAHELQEVFPEAVTGEKDAVEIQRTEVSPAIAATYDDEGNELTPAVDAVFEDVEVPSYQGIDTSFLVATLVKAVQELKAELDVVKSQLANQ